jgi:hypothetical protein
MCSILHRRPLAVWSGVLTARRRAEGLLQGSSSAGSGSVEAGAVSAQHHTRHHTRGACGGAASSVSPAGDVTNEAEGCRD